MFKRLFTGILACTMLVLSFAGCGKEDKPTREDRDLKSHSDSVVESVSSKEEESTVESAVESDSDTEEVSSEKEIEYLAIEEATGFNNGTAWVKSDSHWNIINDKGDIVSTFSSDYNIITGFMGGFSIIDDGTIDRYTEQAKTSDSAIIINDKGETVLDLSSYEYKYIYCYDGLDLGSIVVVKNLDTFEESGDYFYHYDLNAKKETQICPCKEPTDNYLQYVGDGYYIESNKYDTLELVFKNYITGDSVSYENNKTIADAFAYVNKDNKEVKYVKWNVQVVGDYVYLSIYPELYGMDIVYKGFILDLKNKDCKSISLNNAKNDKEGSVNAKLASSYNITAGYVDWHFNNMVIAEQNLYEFYCYDCSNDKYVKFEPKCDYNCEIHNYDNQRFLVTTKNENQTEFYTVLDFDLKPLFTPKKYTETTTLLGDYLISDEDNGSVSIIDLSSNNKVIKEIEKSNITYVDKTNYYVWVETTIGKTECYDIKTGNLICKLDSKYTILSDISNGYVLVKNAYSTTLDFIDTNDVPLKIEK